MIRFFRRPAPTDQADRLRDLVREASADSPDNAPAEAYSGPPLIVLSGSKGGVGTTTLTLELARSLAGGGIRCVAVDANLRQADLGQLAGAGIEDGPNIADVLAGTAPATEAIHFLDDGLWLLPGAWAPDAHPQATAAGAHRLLASLNELGAHADAVVIDAGAGHTPASAPLWQAASAVLMVATPEKLSLLGAYAAIKLSRSAEQDAPNTNLLVNRVSGDADASQVYSQIGKTCQRFLGSGVKSAGFVCEGAIGPCIQWVAEQLDKRLTLSPSKQTMDAPAAA